MSQESWVTLGAIGVFAIALFGYLRNISRDLKAEIGKADDKFGKTRTELVSVFGATSETSGLAQSSGTPCGRSHRNTGDSPTGSTAPRWCR